MPRVGQTATHPDGRRVQWDGGSWVSTDAVAATPTRANAGGKKLSVQAQNFLNTLSSQAAEAGETRKMYEQAEGLLKTLKPGPNRGRFLEIATPEEGGGFFDTLGATVVGGPARLIGAITPKETRAYQGLKRLQSENVLGKQLLQKGPQTESDAARLQLTELSPSKDSELNREIARQGISKTDRIRAKSIFYTQFANKWGLNGTSPNGFTADQLWASNGERIAESLFRKDKSSVDTSSTIRVISRRKVR